MTYILWLKHELGVVSYKLLITSWKLNSTSSNSKVRVQVHKLWSSNPWVQIHELWVQIYELQVPIPEVRVQIHVLRVQIHRIPEWFNQWCLRNLYIEFNKTKCHTFFFHFLTQTFLLCPWKTLIPITVARYCRLLNIVSTVTYQTKVAHQCPPSLLLSLPVLDMQPHQTAICKSR